MALVVQGGNTGLVGGAVPLRGEVVCSLRRLTDLGEVDRASGQVTAGAGVTIAEVQARAASAGWAYGVDLASRDSATVGGSIATNAGGLRVLRYGDTRAQVVGVEAVLGTGDVVSHMSGLTKDNTGYHLPSLLCGSEGTLGVVTAARLRLVPRESERVVALLAFDDVAAALAAVGSLRSGLPSLSAAELFFDEGVALVCQVFGLRPPFAQAHRAYVLVEAAGAGDPADALSSAVDSLLGVADAAVATDAVRAAQLWRYREAHTEAIATVGTPHKLDVTLPAGALAEFVAAVPGVVERVCPGARTWLFGHAGDGNVHVNVTGAAGRRRPDRRGGPAAGGGHGRQHQRRARDRCGQGALALPLPQPGGDRGVPEHQAGARSRRRAQPGRAVPARGRGGQLSAGPSSARIAPANATARAW